MKKLIILIMAVFLVGCTPVQNTPEPPVSEEPVVSVDQKTPEEICEKFKDGSIYDTPFEPLNYSIVPAYPNLSFEQPLYATGAGDSSNRIFVVERTGKIKVFQDDAAVEGSEVFLDLSDRIDTGGSEKGLLGLAFHPNFPENPTFYVYYTNENASVIARYSLDSQGLGDQGSEVVLLSFTQPYANHNGGQLAFGPDGYLYIASGDGGSSGDPQNNAQNPGVLLGKILRIDVDQPQNGKPYGIPTDNPFYNNSEGNAPEIYAFGLRNPWRFSFDPCRELLIAGDVGQGKMEEIDLIEKGGNYGWNIMEGSLDYAPDPAVNKDTLIMPVWEYGRSQGQSITGGYVYYGNQNPSLMGTYVYGDFGSGRIWGLWLDQNRSPHNYELLETDLSISSFGLDDKNEILIVDYQGSLYRIREAS